MSRRRDNGHPHRGLRVHHGPAGTFRRGQTHRHGHRYGKFTSNGQLIPVTITETTWIAPVQACRRNTTTSATGVTTHFSAKIDSARYYVSGVHRVEYSEEVMGSTRACLNQDRRRTAAPDPLDTPRHSVVAHWLLASLRLTDRDQQVAYCGDGYLRLTEWTERIAPRDIYDRTRP